MKLVPDDIKNRVRLAMLVGETGDYEVINYLAQNDMVEEWTRVGTNGAIKSFSNEDMKCATDGRVEVRPDRSGVTEDIDL